MKSLHEGALTALGTNGAKRKKGVPAGALRFIRCLRCIFILGVVSLSSACNQYDPYHPDTKNLEGVWAIDNSFSRRADEPPISKRLTVYATHMEYCPGNGTYGTQGEWRDGGFWCPANGAPGEIEAVKVSGPEEIEFRPAVFLPGNTDVLHLYKEKGSDEETTEIQRTMAAKYPPPLAYPPPQGAIFEGMSEYQLKQLPWKADKVLATGNSQKGDVEEIVTKEDDGTIYSYHSDNAQLIDLRVTVKHHKVISVEGGNG